MRDWDGVSKIHRLYNEHDKEDSQIRMAHYKPWSGFGPLGRSRALLVYHSLDMKRDGEPSSLRQRKTESPAKNEKEQR